MSEEEFIPVQPEVRARQDELMEQCRAMFESQHPMMGLLWNQVERMGGAEFFDGWAERNPNKLMNFLVNMTPRPLSSSSMSGDLNITVNQNLIPTELDSVTIDEQGKIVGP